MGCADLEVGLHDDGDVHDGPLPIELWKPVRVDVCSARDLGDRSEDLLDVVLDFLVRPDVLDVDVGSAGTARMVKMGVDVNQHLGYVRHFLQDVGSNAFGNLLGHGNTSPGVKLIGIHGTLEELYWNILWHVRT